MVDTWADDTGVWGDANASYAELLPVMIKGSAFYQEGSGILNANGQPMITVLERVGIAIAGQDNKGNLLNDPSVVKVLHGIWPIIVGPEGLVLSVYAGAHDSPNGPVRWDGPQQFTIGSSLYVDFYSVVGPYLALRFTSSGQAPWRLLGYDLDIELAGEH